MERFVLFMVGVSFGIFMYELVIRWYTRSSYITRCKMCQWRHRKEWSRPDGLDD